MNKNIPNPIRVQRKRIKGWKMPENTIYVGRPTKFGNPAKVGEIWLTDFPPIENNQKAVYLFEDYFLNNLLLQEQAKSELKGKNLACFCNLNEPCHADILIKFVNEI
jgi:Domain of unknown function (DUF4326)